MKKPEFSVLVPHYAVDFGRRTLRTCLDCLMDNTVNHYELMVYGNSEGGDLYQIYNDMARRASAEWLMLLMYDEYLQPGWDKPAMEQRSRDTLWAFGVVEAGYEPVHHLNIQADLGGSPETFQRQRFEQWASSYPAPPPGFLWIFPWLIHREAFLDLGGFDAYSRESGEWNMTDMFFYRKWEAAGNKVGRLPSWCYHLQRWSLTGDKR